MSARVGEVTTKIKQPDDKEQIELKQIGELSLQRLRDDSVLILLNKLISLTQSERALASSAAIPSSHPLQKQGSEISLPIPNITPEIARRIIHQCLENRIELLIEDTNKTSVLSLNPAESCRAAIPWLKQIVIQGNKHNQSKPLIMLFPYLDTPTNAKEVQAKQTKDNPAMPITPQWISCVALPKNYQAPDGTKTGNDVGEVIFYLDPRCTQKPQDMAQRFWPFYQLLTKGVTFKEKIPGTAQFLPVVIHPPFPRGMFYNASCQQQVSPIDSLGWAVYNAMMIVLTGNTKFISSFPPSPNATLNLRLAQLLQATLSTPVQPVSASSSARPDITATQQPMPSSVNSSSSPAIATPITKESEKKKEASVDLATEQKDSKNIKEQKDAKVAEKPKEQPSLIENSAQVLGMVPIDQSPVIPAYSPKMLAILLNAYRIKHSIQTNCYFYPIQSLNDDSLLRDTILYFLGNQEIVDRRVCFLLKSSTGDSLALILQLSQVNTKIVEALKKQGFSGKTQDENEKIAETILQRPQETQLLKHLYGQIQGLFLGSQATEALIKQLKPLFERAYVGKVSLDFKAAAPINPSIRLADDILQMLTTGRTREISSKALFFEHREQSVKSLLSAAYPKEISQTIEVLLKYLSLEQTRLRYPSKQETLEELENIQTFDFQLKYSIYGKPLNPQELHQGLCQLDLAPIIEMLALKDKPEFLLKQLEHGRRQAQEKIETWERTLQAKIKQSKKGWLPYLRYQTKKTTQFLYQNSLVKLGADSVHWVGQSLWQVLPLSLKSELSDFIPSSAKYTVLLFTLSPRLAHFTYRKTDQWLNRKENASLILKTSGAALGLMGTYAQGFYSSVRMLGISTISLYCYQRLSLPLIINEKAQLIPGTISFSPNTLFRAMNLAIAALEAGYFNNPQLLIHALGGVSGSVAATELAQKLFEPLKIKPGQRPTEDQVYILFLFSLMGYDLGRALGDYGYQAFLSILQEHQLRAKLIERLQTIAAEQQVADFTIEQRQGLNMNPLLWLKPNAEQIKFDWRERDGYFHHADCNVNANTVEGGSTVYCDFTSSPPRLNR